MDYTPKSKEDLEKERAVQGAWPLGEYPFEILDQALIGQYDYYTQEKLSKNNNPMIQLVMVFTHPTGAKRILRDYLLSDNAVKLHDALAACGMAYGSGKLNAQDFIGKRGFARLAVDKDGYNTVRGYIINGAAQPATEPAAASAKADELEDSIPF